MPEKIDSENHVYNEQPFDIEQEQTFQGATYHLVHTQWSYGECKGQLMCSIDAIVSAPDLTLEPFSIHNSNRLC